MQKKLIITSSPHIRDGVTTRRIMQEVCLALAPAGIAGIVLFGVSAAKLIAISVLSCVLFEYLYQKLTNQKIAVGDWSAVVTGLLLAYNLPANAPVWIPIIGGAIAMILVKGIFGGLGSNFMNPALTARAVMFVSWGTIMGSYPATNYMVDATSSATPLSVLANGGTVSISQLLIGNIPGVLGETCKIAIILGGLYLILRGIIDWKIPVCFIGTVFLLYLCKDGFQMAVCEILSGALMLGAFFMATDYVTSPVSNLGRIIMGVGCGILLFVIRAFANYPEGCSFAILFMNVMTPLIDRFTVPKIFGEVKKHA
ncbi:MAG: RnfABCDGE type electron transport complex subunit D [Clostridiales bacterium]|nr:RnfABCDGE type electron transport complex subunit D [Clostridia bacterium]MCR4882312.1 RnfABCDGE type electron transport complex subunit D [Clostridiales bacterium]